MYNNDIWNNVNRIVKKNEIDNCINTIESYFNSPLMGLFTDGRKLYIKYMLKDYTVKELAILKHELEKRGYFIQQIESYADADYFSKMFLYELYIYKMGEQ